MAAKRPNNPRDENRDDSRAVSPAPQDRHAAGSGFPQPVALEFLQRSFSLSATVKRLLATAHVALARKPATLTIASFLHSAASQAVSDADQDVSTRLFSSAAREHRFDSLVDIFSPIAGSQSEVFVSPGLQAAITYADEIRRRTRLTSTQVRRRYVVLAIFARRTELNTEELDAALTATGVDGKTALYEIARYCISRLDRDDNRAEWEQLLKEWGLAELLPRGYAETPGMEFPKVTEKVPPPTVEDSPSPVTDVASGTLERPSLLPVSVVPAGVPLCESDDPWASDLVDRAGASREARAFARMILARQFKPPLAVGVFGSWGSGKSFFMRLVYEQIERGRAVAGAGGPSGPISFLSHVVQIRFNAWHYAETNLWASLVDHIFRELDAWAERREPNLADRLFEQLATARQLTVESAELLITRRRERDVAARKLKSAQAELEEKRASTEQSKVTLIESVWREVCDSVKPELKKQAARLGIEVATEKAEELRAMLSTLDEEVARSALYRASLLRALGRPLAVLGLVVGALALPLLLEAAAKAWHVPLAPVTAAVSGIVATVAGVLGSANRGVSGALRYFRRLSRQFDERVRTEMATAHEDADAAAADLQSRETAVREASEHLEVAGARVIEAIRDYHSQTGRGRVLRFVRERVAKGDYAKQLGFVATVRKDFEELDFLMREPAEAAADTVETRASFAKHVDRVIEDAGTALSEEERTKLKATTASDDVGRVFERIVLYVDDLDRCPPDKVVDVLQAVHLLLTFPLFVVFVAVDVRWLRQALARHYSGQLSEDAGSTSATAGDYLEKIFQVPYWVRSMDADGTRSILRDRLGAEPSEPAATGKSIESRTGDTLEAASRISAEVGTVEKSEIGGVSAAQPSSGLNADPAKEFDANALTLTRRELGFIQRIAAVLDGSPRRTLRFINTYRVLKASLPDAEVGSVEQGDYAGLLTLLALSIAADDAYPTIVQAIETASLTQQPAEKDFEKLAGISAADADRAKRAYELFAAEGGNAASLATYARLVERYTFCDRKL